MRSFVTKNWKIVAPVSAVGLVVVAYLAFAVFGIHTLFTDKKVDEAGPVFESGASADVVEVEEATPPAAAPDDDVVVPAVELQEPAAPEINTVVTGDFVGKDHPSSGVASVLTDGSAQRFLRFENFETDNGPDLSVYLSAAPVDAGDGDFDNDFIDLGKLKGNIGDQNYEIPEDVDLDRYTTVVIWCVRFGVPFGAAGLA